MFEAETNLLASIGVEVDTQCVTNDAIKSLTDKIQIVRNIVDNREQADQISQRVKANRYDLVHIHNFFPLLSPGVHKAAYEAGAAVVQTLHNYRLICANAQFLREGKVCEKCLKGRAAWALVHGCYRGSRLQTAGLVRMITQSRKRGIWDQYVNRFIALTEFSRNKFIQAGLHTDKISVKPNFIPDHYPEQNNNNPRQGALFVGRLSQEKGVHVLVKAWQSLRDIPLTIIGEGPEREALQAQAPSNVTFLGQCDRQSVQKHMQAAQILVFPSIWYEGFPMTLIEAYANNLPVLASDIGSLSEIVIEGQTGWRFEPGNSDALAAKVQTVFREPSRLKRCGDNGRRSYLDHYTPEKNADLMVKIYNEARVDRLGSANLKL